MNQTSLFFTLLISLLTFSSCSNDNDNKTELSVIGGWNVGESKLNGEIVNDQSLVRLLTADNRMEFFFDVDNGGGQFQGEKGSWEMNGNTLTIDFDDPSLDTKVYTVTDIQPSSMTWESEILGEGTLIEILTR